MFHLPHTYYYLFDKITEHLPNLIVLNHGKPPDSKIKESRTGYSKFVEQDYLHDLDNIQVSELMIQMRNMIYFTGIFTQYLISMPL